MNKEKLIENCDVLKDETKTKILEMANKEVGEKCFISKGEKYYCYSNCDGKIICVLLSFYHSDTDMSNIDIGNFFKTEEEAIFAGKCDCYAKKFATYVNRHSDKLDWEIDSQDKFYVWYNYYHKKIVFDYYTTNKAQGIIYASSEEVLKDAITYIGEDNFLKYVMKVGEIGSFC